ncbi:tRNA (adenosine(37)-N6)-dimethylallyltransferase MiaA [Nitrospira sp. KM1]|uniref:tRNA (adenosine(37)-N6)-dimethylallyltransferase MiaA n=1 Tax=Nitrospira sp. KM1 TaxID=1936990 RepID=UPI001567159E|nr:tRNA (adenosine(37)-N6)-dimethylallyltransferase MiaA [Nitrospira sp. KM1]
MTAPALHPMYRLSDEQRWRKPLVVILGPTAVGKSSVALEVAKHYDSEILTADSRQVYRRMDIGTDKPLPHERQGVIHRLIDLVNPDESFNAGVFRRMAAECIRDLHGQGRLPLLVGGTGLYVRVLLQGLCEAPPSDPYLRSELLRQADEQGGDAFFARLAEIDPVYASKLHPRDTSKVLRAIEVYELSGRRMSEFHGTHAFGERPYCTLIVGLDRSRSALYRRIEDRIDRQLECGFVQETQQLLAQGYRRDCAAMKGLGYRQVAAYLAGEYDYDEMVRQFKRDTRRFAKRQLTWFRQEPEVEWLMIEDHELPETTAARVTDRIDRFLAGLSHSV